MSLPEPLLEGDLQEVSLTRRIPVREERSSGWRTRVVDHATESGLRPATTPADKVYHDGVPVLVAILLLFMSLGVRMVMWKRDISKAFRRVPVFFQHLQFAWVVWVHQGQLLKAQHRGMPFGTISAVYAWHRVGHVLLMVVLVVCCCPVARYVDDFFGADREGLVYSGGNCLSVISKLVGFLSEDDKDADNCIQMIVLGVDVAMNWARRTISTVISEVKASKWRVLLQAIRSSMLCDAETASKMAGRLNFAVGDRATE